jgi:hypothetical protein
MRDEPGEVEDVLPAAVATVVTVRPGHLAGVDVESVIERNWDHLPPPVQP